MGKFAVIDIGSNSVRMVVYDSVTRIPNYIFNEKAPCRLGEDLSKTGHLFAEGKIMAQSTLARFITLLQAMKVTNIKAVATAAMREAKDGPEFQAWIAQNLGITVEIISGEQEALLSAYGILLAWPHASGIVCDMGGSSMELTKIHNGIIQERISTKLGPLQLGVGDLSRANNPIKSELHRAYTHISPDKNSNIYLVGGSWRALARIDMIRRNYPLHYLHEYQISPKNISKTLRFIEKNNIDALATRYGISSERAMLLPQAGRVLEVLESTFKPRSFILSAYGLREGLLYTHMSDAARTSDPLLDFARAKEREHARFPGYGEILFDWLKPLYPDETPKQARLRLVACLLHDIHWRAHPDYRAQLSFDHMLYANLCGITHAERVFLAFALAARYENTNLYVNAHAVGKLLDETQIRKARALGRAMRLGAMISGAVGELLEDVTLELDAGNIILRINKTHTSLCGDSVKKRLQSLAIILERKVLVLLE